MKDWIKPILSEGFEMSSSSVMLKERGVNDQPTFGGAKVTKIIMSEYTNEILGECKHSWEYTGQSSAFNAAGWLECSKCGAGKYEVDEKPIMEMKPLQVTRVFMNEHTTGLKRELTVRKAIVFGKSTIYPVCDRAKLFAELVGTITLRAKDLEIIKKMGFLLELEKDEEGV